MRFHTLTLTLAVLAAGHALAATGGSAVVLAHSGYLLGSDDTPVDSKGLAATFRIFDRLVPDAANQVLAWEASCAIDVVRGHYSAALGEGGCAGSGLDTADLPSNLARFLEITIAGEALLPRMRIAAAPLATLAHDAEKLGGALAAAYALKAELSASGTVNTETNPVAWSQLKDVPAGLADGTDDGNVYSSGTGLTLDGTTFALAQDSASLARISGGKLSVETDGRVRVGAELVGGTLTGTTLQNPTLAGNVATAGLTSSSNITATGSAKFVGDGSLLTGLTADKLGGQALAQLDLRFVQVQPLPATTAQSGNVNVTGFVRLGSAPDNACVAGIAGALRYNATANIVEYCNGFRWTSLLAKNGASKGQASRSCLAVLEEGFSTGNGLYWLDPNGGDNADAEQFYCNMTDHGGGWTLVLRAGLGYSLTDPALSTPIGGTPTGPTQPAGGVLQKASDTVINQLRTNRGDKIGYWVTTPGSGTGTYGGAEIFHRSDCSFQMGQLATAVKATTCRDWTISYAAGPIWSAGTHWNDNSTPSYRWAFGYGNNPTTCYQDGRNLGAHEGALAPFHRGWCGTQAWGLVYVR